MSVLFYEESKVIDSRPTDGGRKNQTAQRMLKVLENVLQRMR